MRSLYKSVSPYLLFLPLCYSVFIAADDLTMIVTILPDMMKSLKVPVSDIDRAAWLIISFLIGYSATMPVMGRLSDRWGYRRASVLALSVFVLGSAGIALTPTIEGMLDSFSIASYDWVLYSRIVQSLGAGAVVPIGIASADQLVGPKGRVLAFGLIGASAEAGAVIGPVWAGAITDWLGWEWAFWSNVPLAAVAFIVLFFMPKGRTSRASIDWISAAVFTAALASLTIALFLIFKQQQPNKIPILLKLFGIGIACVAVLVVRLQRSDVSSATQILIRLGDFNWANITHFLVGAALMMGLISVPLISGTIYNLSALDSGLLLMRATISLGVGALAGGILATNIGVRTPLIAGLAISAVAFFYMSNWCLELELARASMDLILLGIGLGLVVAPITESALRRVPEDEKGVASGVLTLARNIGMTVGLASVSSLGTERYLLTAPAIEELIANPIATNEAGLAIFASFFTYGAIICVVAIVPAWLTTRKYKPIELPEPD